MSPLDRGSQGRRGPASAAPVVGMVGAGQLARMTHRAAIDLGVELLVLAGGERDPAVLAGARHVVGSADSIDDLRGLASGCDVLTLDHERVPAEHLEALHRSGVALEPSPAAVLLAQDKLHGRRALARAGLPVPAHAHVAGTAQIRRFAAAHGERLIAKAPRGGYDGRGVWEIDGPAAAAELLPQFPGGILLERRIDIEMELSVLVARTRDGRSAVYDPVQTIQRGGMCREVIAPAPVDDEVARRARALALEIAERFGCTGIVAVELFLTAEGLLVNELALRPHNSGHHTIEGCVTSQFEQHLRAVLGMPVGSTAMTAPAVAMVNVVGGAGAGDPRQRLASALAVEGAHVHLYAKDPSPGRKLGHVTACASTRDAALAAARGAAALLGGDRS